jgi:hypothetical protein
LVESEKRPKPVAWICRRYPGEFQNLGHHKQHHEAAISVHGYVAGHGLGWKGRLRYIPRC